jgi:hypothetical protein
MSNKNAKISRSGSRTLSVSRLLFNNPRKQLTTSSRLNVSACSLEGVVGQVLIASRSAAREFCTTDSEPMPADVMYPRHTASMIAGEFEGRNTVRAWEK